MRRFLSWILTLATAISLMFAAIRGAQVAPDALKELTLFQLPLFFADMRDTLMLAGIALLTGTGAILIAPPPPAIAYRVISDKREKGVQVRDFQPGASSTQLVRIDSRTRGASRRSRLSALPNTSHKRPA